MNAITTNPLFLKLKNAINHPFFVWLLLALPSPPLLLELYRHERYYAEIMYESGVLATQLMMLALAITPLMYFSNGWWPIRWLLKRRRAIGVASFAYASIHTIYYVREVGTAELIWLEIFEFDLLIGWLAMIVMSMLALISNNASLQQLGKNWKPLQRLIYPGAVLVALHWYLIGQFLPALYMYSAVIIGIQLYRLLPRKFRKRLSINLPAAQNS